MSDHDSCPFCRYSAMTDWVRGPVWVGDRFIFRDRPRPVIYFEPLNPVTPGHLLFVPADHSEHRDLDAATLALKSAYDYGTSVLAPDGGPPEDFNLVLSSVSAATQTVDHLHVHYIPRRPNDGLDLPWTAQHDNSDQELADRYHHEGDHQ